MIYCFSLKVHFVFILPKRAFSIPVFEERCNFSTDSLAFSVVTDKEIGKNVVI